MPGRPISYKLRVWLTGEIEGWSSAGIVDAEQVRRILDLYETSDEAANRRRSVALMTLMSLGAVLVGMAAFLLIGYNWGGMPAAIKLAFIFGTVFATYAGAFWLRYARRARPLSEAFFLLGGIFYGCAIMLIAQVFHIQSHFPDGLWFWAVGLLPLALCLDTLLVHFLYVAVLALWVGTELLGFGRPIPWLFLHGWYLADGAYSLPLLALPGLFWAYQRRSPLTLGLYVPLVTWWIVLQPVAWHWPEQAVFAVGAAGALLLLIGELHRPGSLLTTPYRFYGVLLMAGALVPLTFARFHAYWPHSGQQNAGFIVAGATALAGMFILGLTVVLERDSQGGVRRPAGQRAQVLLQRWIPTGLMLLMAGMALWHASLAGPYPRAHGLYAFPTYATGSPIVLVPTVAANVAMIFLAFWLMRSGLREDRVRPFAGGVLLFLLWAVLRYADLFGGAGGMLGAAAVFFACGAALFGVAWFWRHRKEITHVPVDR